MPRAWARSVSALSFDRASLDSADASRLEGWPTASRMEPMTGSQVPIYAGGYSKAAMRRSARLDGFLSAGNLGTTNASTAVTKLNTKLTTVCNSMKAQGILIYTVLFEESDNTVKNLLKGCASQADFFFDSPDEETLKKAFRAIGDSLSELRVSR